jgi:predicted TIM-barrel fold metal-dependent hydrolase
MHDGIEIVDAQVHCWQTLIKPHWSPTYRGANQDSFSIEMALAAMDAIGVDAAVIDFLSDDPRTTWKDNNYAEEASRRFPERLASVVRGFDLSAGDIDETVEAVRTRPGVLGVRISLADENEEQFLSGSYERLLAATQRCEVPLLVFCRGRTDLVKNMASAFPDLTIFVVHLGLPQPPSRRDDPPFLRLPDLLALAEYPNVSVGLMGGPSLSNQGYPFVDLWPHLTRLFDAFSLERVAWGSDFTRSWGIHTYAEEFGYLWYSDELSKSDKEKLFGTTLRRILKWESLKSAV